jgi:hypothetical protein
VAQGVGPEFKLQYRKKKKKKRVINKVIYISPWFFFVLRKKIENGHWCLMPVILATQEVEIRRIEV